MSRDAERMKPTDDTAPVEFQENGISVDASLIAEDLGIDPSAVQAGVRQGKITSLCERGIDQDAGCYRVTFFHRNRRLRLVVDLEGNVLRRSLLNFGDRTLPASFRKAGQ
jgi:hypothetical protein